LIDDVFLSRVKALADPHIAQHIETSITELEEKHVEDAISLEDQLIQIRLQIKRKLAMLEDEILTLDVESKKKYNGELLGLRAQEKEVLKTQQQANHTDLKAD
jgi:hypothetical protein